MKFTLAVLLVAFVAYGTNAQSLNAGASGSGPAVGGRGSGSAQARGQHHHRANIGGQVSGGSIGGGYSGGVPVPAGGGVSGVGY